MFLWNSLNAIPWDKTVQTGTYTEEHMLWCSATLPHFSENSRKTPFRPPVNRHPKTSKWPVSAVSIPLFPETSISPKSKQITWWNGFDLIQLLNILILTGTNEASQSQQNGATSKYVKNNMWGWTEPRRIESETKKRNDYQQQTSTNYDVISCYLQQMNSIIKCQSPRNPGWILDESWCASRPSCKLMSRYQ